MNIHRRSENCGIIEDMELQWWALIEMLKKKHFPSKIWGERDAVFDKDKGEIKSRTSNKSTK